MVTGVTATPALRTLVGSPSLRAQVGQQLRDALVAGELVPGVVYSAPVLGIQLGVSATPVREAMLDLVRDGLVETVRNKGFRVVELSPQRLADLLAVRADLESAGLARVAAAPRQDLEELEGLLADMAAAGARGDVRGYVEADRRFHLGLLALDGNVLLLELVTDLRSRTQLHGLAPLAGEPLARTATEHHALLDAVRCGDPAAASALMRTHIAHVADRWTGTTPSSTPTPEPQEAT